MMATLLTAAIQCVVSCALSLQAEQPLISMTIFTDLTPGRPAGYADILVEFRNSSEDSIRVPSPKVLQDALRCELVNEDGEKRHYGGRPAGTSVTSIVLPPGCAVHCHILPGSDWVLPPSFVQSTIKVSVSIDFSALSVGSEQPSAESGGMAVVSGRASSNTLDIRLASGGYDVTEAGVPEDLQAIRLFRGETRQKLARRNSLEALRQDAAKGRLAPPLETRMRELEALDLDLSPSDIEALAIRWPRSQVIDDAWFDFSSLRAWGPDENVRAGLMRRIQQLYPESTGARQASEWQRWPGYKDTVLIW